MPIQLTSTTLSQFIQLPPNIALSRVLPRRLLKFHVYLLGLIYYVFNGNERSTVLRTVKEMFGKDTSRPHLAGRIFKGIFDHYYEKLIMAHRPLEEVAALLKDKVRIENEDWLRRANSSGKRILMITGHFGAVEFLPFVLSLAGYKIAIILNLRPGARKKELIKRANKYNQVIIDINDSGALLSAIASIKQGRIFITFCDEFEHWRPHPQQEISVLNSIVPADRTINIIYRRTSPFVCMALMLREERGYVLNIQPILDTGGKGEFALSSRVWQTLEDWIRKYPEQWYQWNKVAEGLATYRLNER